MIVLGSISLENPSFRHLAKIARALGVEYNNSVSAPVAVVKNNPLRMTVKYECNGVDSLELLASYDSNYDCPFSHINSETIVCNRAGEIEMHSISSSSTVDAYLSHYEWQITNISYGSTIINQPFFIQSTWHTSLF